VFRLCFCFYWINGGTVNSLFSKLSVKNKILFPLLLIMSFAILGNYFILTNKIKAVVDNVAANRILQFRTSLESNIKRVSKKALLVASVFSTFDFVKKAYEFENEKEGRNYLRENLTVIIKKLEKELNIREFKLHFHKPPARSFLRVWRKRGVKDGGDDLSSFRNIVLSANKKVKAMSGVEPGRGGIPMRGVAPIVFNGKHYGSVELFFAFNSLRNIIKFDKNDNFAVFIDKNTVKVSYEFKNNKKVDNFTFASSIKKIELESINKRLLSKGYKKSSYEISKNRVNVAFPLKDYSNKIFGVIYYTFDIEKLINQQKDILIIVFLSYLFVGAIIVFILNFISKKVVSKPLDELVRKSKKLSKGYLTEKATMYYADEIGKISEAYNDVVKNLQSIVLGINESTDEVSNATNEIASSSDELATRTNEQAASITQTSTTLEEFTSIINQNSQNANETGNLLESLNSQVQQNVELINEVNNTMIEINDSGKEINNIVSVINDISFQTNLLALNAAVEAARAGEHGKGFAVVASEVRNLAGKTAESSKSIQEIIHKNMKSTTRGMELASKTSELFSSIVAVMNDVLGKIKQINEGSNEQSTGISQINEAVNQLETVINQNAALVEELSATGKNLKGNVRELFEEISKLKVEK